MTSNKHNTELIQYHLDRLTRHHGPVHSIVVTDEILPIGCVMVADDHATEICNANQLLELLRVLRHRIFDLISTFSLARCSRRPLASFSFSSPSLR